MKEVLCIIGFQQVLDQSSRFVQLQILLGIVKEGQALLWIQFRQEGVVLELSGRDRDDIDWVLAGVIVADQSEFHQYRGRSGRRPELDVEERGLGGFGNGSHCRSGRDCDFVPMSGL